MRVTILNAGEQTDYLYGLVSALARIALLQIEVIDSSSSVGLIDAIPGVKLFNYRGDNVSPQSFLAKVFRISRYYLQLFAYSVGTKSRIFHIQWDNSLFLFDRTVLILFYKLLGKKLIYTAHNIDKAERDGHTSIVNRFSLRAVYRSVDIIIVHTQKMKDEIVEQFRIQPEKINVIPHGLNVRIPRTDLTKSEARAQLQIPERSKVVLFFGFIDRYKGVETAIDAVSRLSETDPSILLLIAGSPKRKSMYVSELQSRAESLIRVNQIRFDLRYIPVDEVERYFAASDCIVLPYRRIFQSGVIFLAYRFGVPLVATDVGSLGEDVVRGETGYICKADDAVDMADTLRQFFESELYRNERATRNRIIEYAEKKYSWDDIARRTAQLYQHATSTR